MTVYHYTSAEGLIGMLENKQIWATDLRFLNDSKEYIHSLEIFKKLLPKYGIDVKNLSETDPKLYVACFSKQSDSLSQWRGYTDNSKGYCIGLNIEKIQLNTQISQGGQGIELEYLFYESGGAETYLENRMAEIKELDNEIEEMYKKIQRNYEEYVKSASFRESISPYDEWIKDTQNREILMAIGIKQAKREGRLYTCLAFCKDKAFQAEEEYRVAFYNPGGPIYFRTRNNLVIPYVKLNIGGELQDLISDIYIGPGLDQLTAYSGVEKLLEVKGFPKERIKGIIKFSDVPYRS